MVEIVRGVALLSVSNKDGIEDFARSLSSLGFTLMSTGGTATVLRKTGLDVIEVSKYTGFPEMMGGRVKTLHPLVHGGLLGRPEDAEVMKEHGIKNIDILVVNLYPFEATIAKPGCTFEEAVEQIDIDGPAMLRSAAKNHGRVIPICNPADYSMVLDYLRTGAGTVPAEVRRSLTKKVFALMSEYDGTIADYL